MMMIMAVSMKILFSTKRYQRHYLALMFTYGYGHAGIQIFTREIKAETI